MSTQPTEITEEIETLRRWLAGKGSRVHLVGVCGVGMAGLAFHLKHRGFQVSGCDCSCNHLSGWLEAHGITVTDHHDPAHVAGADWVVRSAAVRADHPEIVAARHAGLPVFRRGSTLAALLSGFTLLRQEAPWLSASRLPPSVARLLRRTGRVALPPPERSAQAGRYGGRRKVVAATTAEQVAPRLGAGSFTSVAVSGTHGKTTTTSMIVQTLRSCGLSPSFCIGGESPILGGVAGAGSTHGAWRAEGIMVVEADESDGTLADYEPDIAVITNIEFDHAEYFDGIEALRACFAGLVHRVKKRLIFCVDDLQARELCRGQEKSVSYGFSPSADWRATAVSETERSISFHVMYRGEERGVIALPAPGCHNALNALAACAVAAEWNAGFADIQRGLQGFEPVRRRFERIIEKDDVLVISDYAHHPTEVATVMRTVKRIKRSRWLAVFQPHRFSRTLALGKDFPQAFEGVDELILTPVYAASEPLLTGGTSSDLYAHFRRADKTRTVCASSLSQAWAYLRRMLRKGDGLLIIGAGDVEKIAEWAKTDIASRGVEGLNPVPGWVKDLQGLELEGTTIRMGEPLNRRTTLHVGGKADIFLDVGGKQDLARLLKWTHDRRIPWVVLGAGSNSLASDLGVRGVMLHLVGDAFCGIREDGASRIIIGAGTPLHELTTWAADHGKSGLEFLKGIPGTVGGALRMNAGAWGQDMGQQTDWIRWLNPDGSEQVVERSKLPFTYRECEALGQRVIIEAALTVAPDDSAAIRDRMEDIARRRVWMNGVHSAGSVFKNPEGDFAGRLLEQAGLKGYRIGGARVSERHANVIVTEKAAVASDVMALTDIMRNEVKTRFGVELIREIKCLE